MNCVIAISVGAETYYFLSHCFILLKMSFEHVFYPYFDGLSSNAFQRGTALTRDDTRL